MKRLHIEFMELSPAELIPRSFAKEWRRYPRNGALRYEGMSSAQFSDTIGNILRDKNKYWLSCRIPVHFEAALLRYSWKKSSFSIFYIGFIWWSSFQNVFARFGHSLVDVRAGIYIHILSVVNFSYLSCSHFQNFYFHSTYCFCTSISSFKYFPVLFWCIVILNVHVVVNFWSCKFLIATICGSFSSGLVNFVTIYPQSVTID